jgi:hypothetical protein
MRDSATVAAALAVIVLATVGILFEAWLLGVILSWFGVSLTFWQNLAMIVLANLIFKNSGGSSK